MENIIETKGLSKTFKGKEVISNVNMTVRKGEIYGFLGQNGAGKTTIMRMLTGLMAPSKGSVHLFGKTYRKTKDANEIKKRIGTIIEYPVFYDHLTGEENLRLHGQYMNVGQLEQTIQEVLKLVKLNPEGKKVREYSLGMKQRLGIARAIMTSPELLILDEPINGLDPMAIRDLRTLLLYLSKEQGMTILVSSHILSEIEQIVDTIGIIKDGSIIQESSIQELQQNKEDYLVIEVDDLDRALFVLREKLRILTCKAVDQHTIQLQNSTGSPSKVLKELILADVNIHSFNKKKGTLEHYFVDMMEGKKHA